MTLDSCRGGDAIPVRSAFATMTVVVAAVVGALVFATSLTHLVSTPALQGWRWDVLLAGDDAHRIAEQLAADDTSPAVADAVLVPLRLEGQKVADARIPANRRGRLFPDHRGSASQRPA